MLGRLQEVDAPHRRRGIGHQSPQHPDVPGSDGLDRGPVEEVGRVLDGAACPVAFVRGDVELQVELGGLGAELFEVEPGRQSRQVHLGPRDVLPGEEDLEERVVGGGALGAELVDQHVEGDVLVVVRTQRFVLHLVEEVLEGGVAGQLHPQHPGVDEEADEIGQRVVDAAGDRGADRDVLTAAQVVQQHAECRLQDHRNAQAAGPGQFLDIGPEPGLDAELDVVARMAGHRRAGPVQGKVQRLVHAGELLAPVGELLAQEGLGVVLVPEQIALPQRVVGVLDLQFLPARRVAVAAGGVGGRQVAQQRYGRLPVRGDVVEQQDQHVCVGGVPHQMRPDRHLRVQVERVGDQFPDGPIHLVR